MADLLHGTSASIIADNVRYLKSQGYPEAEAVARAHEYANGSDEADEVDDSVGEDIAAAAAMQRKHKKLKKPMKVKGY